jgi:hypothetical protein
VGWLLEIEIVGPRCEFFSCAALTEAEGMLIVEKGGGDKERSDLLVTLDGKEFFFGS